MSSEHSGEEDSFEFIWNAINHEIENVKVSARDSVGILEEARKMLAQCKSQLLEETKRYDKLQMKHENVKCEKNILKMKMKIKQEKNDRAINEFVSLQKKYLTLYEQIEEESDQRSSNLVDYETKMQHLKTNILKGFINPCNSRPCVHEQCPIVELHQEGGGGSKENNATLTQNDDEDLLKLHSDIYMALGIFKAAADKLTKVQHVKI
ncbi:hypothetical protein CHUAL_003235 [Chamberlinius hualienensis]